MEFSPKQLFKTIQNRTLRKVSQLIHWITPNQFPGSYPESFGGTVDFNSSFYDQSQQCGFNLFGSVNKNDYSGNQLFNSNPDNTSYRLGFNLATNKCTNQKKLESIRQRTSIVNTCTTSRAQLALAGKNPDLACEKINLDKLGIYED